MSRGDRYLTLAAGWVLLIVLGFVGLKFLVGWAYSSMTYREEERQGRTVDEAPAREIGPRAVTDEGPVVSGAAGDRYEDRGESLARLRVYVTTKGSQPIAGAQVTVRIFDRYWGRSWVQEGREPSVRRTRLSNARGEAFFVLPAMETHAILFVDAESDAYSIRSRHRVLSAGETPKGSMSLQGMARDFRIEGRVLDLEGQALRGAKVGYSGFGRSQLVLTDERGGFVLTVPRLGSVQARAWAHDRVRRRQTIPTPEDRQGASCVFRLGKGRSVSGRVVDAKGQAIDGAIVVIRTRRTQESGRTDDKGRFLVQHLDPVQALQGIDISHADFLSTKRELPEKANADLGVFRLERGMSLRGRVVDPRGRVVQGALVFLTHSRDRLDRISDDRGRFSYEGGIPKGPVALLAKAPGFGAGTLKLQATAGRGSLGDITLKLAENHSIGGQIRDAQGKPIAGIHVSAYRLDDKWGFQLEKSAVSDARGHYRITGLPLEKLEIYAHGALLWRDRVCESHVDRENLDFVLDPILALRLRIVDAQTGKPIPHLQITAWLPGEALVRVPLWWRKDPQRPGLHGWSRPHVPRSGEVQVRISELLEAQPLTLVLEAKGYKTSTIQSLPASTEPKLQTVHLEK